MHEHPVNTVTLENLYVLYPGILWVHCSHQCFLQKHWVTESNRCVQHHVLSKLSGKRIKAKKSSAVISLWVHLKLESWQETTEGLKGLKEKIWPHPLERIRRLATTFCSDCRWRHFSWWAMNKWSYTNEAIAAWISFSMSANTKSRYDLKDTIVIQAQWASDQHN